MKYYFSPSLQGFYLDEVHDEIPKDAFEVPADDYHRLFMGQTAGQQIAYKDNKLQLVAQTIEVSWETVRNKRNRLLDESDWTQVSDNGLTDDQRNSWKVYRQKLRDITKTYSDPVAVVLPAEPR